MKLYFGEKDIINKLERIFISLDSLTSEIPIKIQLDPTFQPHYKLYKGIVFQLVNDSDTSPEVIARGGRYDELVKSFGAKEPDAAAIGFSFAIDKIRELKNDWSKLKGEQRKILVAFGINSNLEKALNKQKEWHQKGVQAVLELKACHNISEANSYLKQRACTELDWIES